MRKMLEELGEAYDIILLDSPPVLAVIDPVIISSITRASCSCCEEARPGGSPS